MRDAMSEWILFFNPTLGNDRFHGGLNATPQDAPRTCRGGQTATAAPRTRAPFGTVGGAVFSFSIAKPAAAL